MVFDNVRDSLVKDSADRKNSASFKQSLEAEIKNLFRLGAGFFSEKNYSNSFYCYYLAVRKMCLHYVEAVLNQPGIPEEDALQFAARNGRAGLSGDLLKTFSGVVDNLFSLGEASRSDAVSVRRVAFAMRKELK